MKTLKKILLIGGVCFVGYKLGQKLMEEKNIAPSEVVDDLKAKAEACKEQAEEYIRKAKSKEKEQEEQARKVYVFGPDKRIEIIRLSPDVTGLYDNKLNLPIEKQVRSYSEDGDTLYVYAAMADYVIKAEPFHICAYVKNRDNAPLLAESLGAHYSEDEATVYCYGKTEKVPLVKPEPEPEVVEPEAEAAEPAEQAETADAGTAPEAEEAGSAETPVENAGGAAGKAEEEAPKA